jgi:hypothetical protein
VSRTAARAYGVSGLWAALRARRLRRGQEFRYDEALREGLLDPAIPDHELAGYASRHAILRVQEVVNPPALASLTDQKALFYRFCSAAGLPVPRLVAVVDRLAGGWAPPGRTVSSGDEFAEVLREGPPEIVVKPSDGGHGRGVRVLTRTDGHLVDHAGARTSPRGLYDEIRRDPEFGCHIVQERLRNHPALDAVVPSPALQTLRISTLVDRRGQPHVLQAAMRLALATEATDNFGDGSVGNGYAEVDPQTGRMGPLRLAGPGGVGLVSSPTVPSTGAPVEGVRLPHWEGARDLALDAALRFLPSRALGWDIALTRDGPVLVEGNRCWHPWTTPDAAEMVRRMRDE